MEALTYWFRATESQRGFVGIRLSPKEEGHRAAPGRGHFLLKDFEVPLRKQRLRKTMVFLSHSLVEGHNLGERRDRGK